MNQDKTPTCKKCNLTLLRRGDKYFCQKCTNDFHVIGRRATGGFAGHEQIHPTGDQICLGCGLELQAIILNGIEFCGKDL